MRFFDKRKRQRRKAERDRTSLGNVLLELGYCTQADVAAALQEQCETPLGERLLDSNAITTRQLQHALLWQQVLRGQADTALLQPYGSEQFRAIDEVVGRLRHIADAIRQRAREETSRVAS